MTFNVRGHKVRSASRCRFIVVAVRPTDVTYDGRIYAAFASIIRRSDNYETAKTAARRYGFPPGACAVVMDSTTGEEVS